MYSFFKSIFLITFLFFLTSCNDSSNILSEEKLFQEAEILKKEGKYKEAAKLFDKVELNFTNSEKAADALFDKGVCYFLQEAHPMAISVLETFIQRYPFSPKIIEAKKIIFFSYYNRLTRYDRNFDLLKKALKEGAEFQAFNVQDKDVDQALIHIQELVVYSQLNIIDFSLENNPKLWIQALWSASDLIRTNSEHQLSAEAYYRIIEILANQDNELLVKDALKVWDKMNENLVNSIWHEKALNLLQKVIEKNNFEISLSSELEEEEDLDF